MQMYIDIHKGKYRYFNSVYLDLAIYCFNEYKISQHYLSLTKEE